MNVKQMSDLSSGDLVCWPGADESVAAVRVFIAATPINDEHVCATMTSTDGSVQVRGVRWKGLGFSVLCQAQHSAQ